MLAGSGRQIYIIQDLWSNDQYPKQFIELLNSKNLNLVICSSDYTITNDFNFAKPESKNWHRAGAANLTGFKLVNDDYFWLIDADDTIFLSNPKVVYQKICLAEEIAILKKLDGFSYAFYRHIPINHWSFGVAFMRKHISMDNVRQVNWNDIIKLGIADNLDGAFDLLRKSGSMQLESFVFSEIIFHHHTPRFFNFPVGAALGVYYWEGRVLNGLLTAPPDVMFI